jgi:uncharacterized protein (TIGR03086 family)
VTTEKLEKAYASTTRVLANVSKEELAAATPCKSWTVADLVNHIVSAPFYFADAIKAGEGSSDGSDVAFADADFNSSFAEGTRLAVAAFGVQGAMEKTVTLPFGVMPGAQVMNIAALDCFVHGWDLAKATGQSTDLDPALATEMLALAKANITDAIRGDEPAPFGPAVDVKTGAPAADQLAGFLGRTP